jgi:solute carrier family 25 citrate transporter 1
MTNFDFYENRKILFGPLASLAESICVYPLDSLKVLKQSNQKLPHVRYLYNGFTPFLSQMFVKYSLRFTTFELLKSKNNNFGHNFCAGVVAGIAESTFITPFELIKTNLQTSIQKSSPSAIIKDIYNSKGVKGLYRGFSSTCIRQCANQSFNFSVYYKLREYFVKGEEKPKLPTIIMSILFSSSIGPILTSPFDIIKTRFMNPKFHYKTVYEAYLDILKNEGSKAFYKGIGYRLARVSGGQVITFCVIEQLMDLSK